MECSLIWAGARYRFANTPEGSDIVRLCNSEFGLFSPMRVCILRIGIPCWLHEGSALSHETFFGKIWHSLLCLSKTCLRGSKHPKIECSIPTRVPKDHTNTRDAQGFYILVVRPMPWFVRSLSLVLGLLSPYSILAPC